MEPKNADHAPGDSDAAPGDVDAARLPPACTLGLEDGAERMRRWRALSEQARPVAHRSGHRLEVRYQPAPGARDELEALAAAERRCCSFVEWEVSQEGEHPVLHLTANRSTPDDVAAIAALFGAD